MGSERLGVPNGRTAARRTRSAVSSASRSSACSRASPAQSRLRVLTMRCKRPMTAWWNGLSSGLSATTNSHEASSRSRCACWSVLRATSVTTLSTCGLIFSSGKTPASQSFRMTVVLYRAAVLRASWSIRSPISSAVYSVVGVVGCCCRPRCGVRVTSCCDAIVPARSATSHCADALQTRLLMVVQSARIRTAPCFVPIFRPLVAVSPPRTGRLTSLALLSLTLGVCMYGVVCPSVVRCASSLGFRPALGSPAVSLLCISPVLGVCGVMRRASCVLATVVRAVCTSGCVTCLILVHARCRRHPPFTLLHTMALFMLCIGVRRSGHAPRVVRVAPPCSPVAIGRTPRPLVRVRLRRMSVALLYLCTGPACCQRLSVRPGTVSSALPVRSAPLSAAPPHRVCVWVPSCRARSASFGSAFESLASPPCWCCRRPAGPCGRFVSGFFASSGKPPRDRALRAGSRPGKPPRARGNPHGKRGGSALAPFLSFHTFI